LFVGVFFNWVQRRSSRPRPAEGREATGRRLQRSAGRATADRRESDARTAAAVEKRERERLRLDGPLRGEVMVFQPMTILDISQIGAQIQTAFALQFGSEHDFLLSLGQRAVIVKGRVAYCHISELTDSAASYRSGVAFVETSPAAASAILDFVSAIQYRRS
jgi:hypothetical protein